MEIKENEKEAEYEKKKNDLSYQMALL